MTAPSTRPRYWFTQLLVWFAYALLNILFTLLMRGPSGLGVAGPILLSATLLGVSHALRSWMHSRRWLELGVFGMSWRLVLASIFLALVVQAAGTAVLLGVSTLDGFTPPQGTELSVRVFLVYWINTTIILLLWAITYASYKAFERWRLGEIDRWRTQAMLREAELDLLKAQLDPHFVFNALNNIRAVILENPQRARDMLTHLSQSLRHVLQHSRRSLVSLREELAAVDDYLALIDLHTDGAMRVSRSIDPQALDAQIPPLAVQLLIENAIKHGADPRAGGLGLHVSKSNDGITIEVSNPGRLVAKTTGIGLPNLRERLSRAFGPKASCELSERDARVYATLSVPQ